MCLALKPSSQPQGSTGFKLFKQRSLSLIASERLGIHEKETPNMLEDYKSYNNLIFFHFLCFLYLVVDLVGKFGANMTYFWEQDLWLIYRIQDLR